MEVRGGHIQLHDQFRPDTMFDNEVTDIRSSLNDQVGALEELGRDLR